MNTLLSISYFWSAEAVVAIFICVILPCVIVWLASRTRMHEMDRKTELAIKAIESGVQIDPDFFSKSRGTKTIKEKIFGRLTAGCILSGLGLALCEKIARIHNTTLDIRSSEGQGTAIRIVLKLVTGGEDEEN